MAFSDLAPLLLFILPLCSAQSTYYVTPTPDVLCPGEPCRIFSEYVEEADQYFTSNAKFVFLSGNHLLDNSIRVENMNNLTLAGDSSSLPQVTSTITCTSNPAAHVVFHNVSELCISALAFDSCGSGIATAVTLTSISNSQISSCIFQNSRMGEDSLQNGGALRVSLCRDVVISESTFENNSSPVGGGAYVENSTVSFVGNHFVNNNAIRSGGGMYQQFSMGYFNGNNFTGNTVSSAGGGLAILFGMANFFGETNFVNNTAMGFAGGMLAQFGEVEFSGDTNFEMNSARISGGAMLVYNNIVNFLGSANFLNSSSDYGGGVAVITSYMSFVDVDFENSEAIYGAGIYSRASNLTFSGKALFLNNTASFGGAIYASNSNYHFEGSINFTQNSAIDGGGILLLDGSIFYYFLGAEVYFIRNHAEETGGAIKIEESTPLIYCIPDRDLRTAVSSDCFFQFEIQNLTSYTPSQINSMLSMTFEDNFAAMGGSDLYGGILEGCRLQNFAAIVCPQEFCVFKSSGEVFDLVAGSTPTASSISSPHQTLYVSACVIMTHLTVPTPRFQCKPTLG